MRNMHFDGVSLTLSYAGVVCGCERARVWGGWGGLCMVLGPMIYFTRCGKAAVRSRSQASPVVCCKVEIEK